VGAVIAALTPYEADEIAARLIGIDENGVPTLAAAKRRGLCGELRGSALYGDTESLAVPDFKKVPRRSHFFFKSSKIPLLGKAVEDILTQRPKPIRKKCIACRKCESICPAKAITMKTRGGHKYPVIDRKKCIRCFCCQEFCPKAAMIVHRTLVMRLIAKK
jgi:ferredoxin